MQDPFAPLLHRIANGDHDAFRELHDGFGPRLMGFLHRKAGPQAEELFQDVMLNVWRRAGTFDASRGRAQTWLFTIARNRWVDHCRRVPLTRSHPDDPHWIDDEQPDRVLQRAQEAERVHEALKTLPAPQREVLERTFYGHQSYPEIAEALGIALGTVKSRARLGFARMRTELDA